MTTTSRIRSQHALIAPELEVWEDITLSHKGETIRIAFEKSGSIQQALFPLLERRFAEAEKGLVGAFNSIFQLCFVQRGKRAFDCLCRRINRLNHAAIIAAENIR